MQDPDLFFLAERLHAAAIHLLRRSRRGDPEAGLSPARLSVLAVLVYGGAAGLSDLARAEQVKPPTMSRLVDGLEAAGLVVRAGDPRDRRKVRVTVTEQGRAVLEGARQRRIAFLVSRVAACDEGEKQVLGHASAILSRLFGPAAAEDDRAE